MSQPLSYTSKFPPVGVASDWSHPAFTVGRENVRFHVVTGTVFGSTAHTATHVSGDGSHIYSRTDIKREFFLRRDDTGADEAFRFTNIETALHDGQRVSVIGAYRDGSSMRWWTRLVHHDTERFYSVGQSSDLAIKLGLSRSLGITIVIAMGYGFAATIVLGIVANIALRIPGLELVGGLSLALLFIGTPIACIIYCVSQALAAGSRAIRLDAHCNQVAHDVLGHVVKVKRA